MTLTELKNILERTGLPVAYLAFPEEDVPPMPFITYEETGSDNFGADNKVWYSSSRIQVDLFSFKKNPAMEKNLEAVLNEAAIFWERIGEFDENEDCYRTIYEFII